MREMILWPWDGWGEAGVTPSLNPSIEKEEEAEALGATWWACRAQGQ
jgi:hypothetical protein